MADNQLRVSLTATDDGLKATIDSAVRDINRVQAATEQAARSSSSALTDSRTAISEQTREITQSVRTIGALLASGHITKLTGDYVDFGNIVSAVFAGRLVGSVAQFSAETLNSAVAAAEQRRAMLAAAEAAMIQHRALSIQYAALVASGQASTIYGQSLRAQVVASTAATVAARAQAVSMGLLRGVYATLGGPVGIITIAATALALWAATSNSADEATKKLAKSSGDAADGISKLTSENIARRIIGMQDALAKMGDTNPAGSARLRGLIAEQEKGLREEFAASDRVQKLLDSYRPKTAKASTPEKTAAQMSAEAQADELKKLQALLADFNPNEAAAFKYLESYQLLEKYLSGPELSAAVDSLNEKFKTADNSTEQWASGEADRLKHLQEMLAEFDPNESAAFKYLEDYKLLAAYLSGPELDAAVKGLNAKFANTDKVKEAADEVAQIYKDTATGIRGGFRGALRDALDSTNTFASRMRSLFKDLLADMATLAITRPIIVPIVTSLGGVLGVSGAAQASVLGQLGVSGTGAAGAGALSLAGLTGNFGAGFSAGMQGGFGAAGALAGTTTGATAAGAYAGAALPYVGGALAYYTAADMIAGGSTRRRNMSLLTGLGTGLIDRVTGGGLFGTGTRVTTSGLELSVGGGDVSGRQFEDKEKKKSLYRGKKEGTDYSPADAQLLGGINSALDADMSQLVAGARGLGVNAAEGILSGFASQTRLELKGKSQEEVQKAIQDWIDATFGSMAQAVLKDTKWSGLLKNASREMVESLFSLGQFFAANPLADANEMMRVASRTYKQQLDDQRKALMSLSAVYDGSVGATQQLAAAAKDYYQIELAYLQQIAAVRTDVRSTLAGSIENIRQSTMAPDQLYNYLQSRSLGLTKQLERATDPTQIQDLVREINASANQAYGLIPESERAAYAEQFINFLTDVQTSAGRQLDAAQNQVVDIHRDMSNAVTSTMQGVAERMNDSSRQLKDAAAAISTAAGLLTRTLTDNYYKYK